MATIDDLNNLSGLQYRLLAEFIANSRSQIIVSGNAKPMQLAAQHSEFARDRMPRILGTYCRRKQTLKKLSVRTFLWL